MNKKDRKAWLRIVEAFLAVLIVISAVLVILARQPPEKEISEDIYEIQRQILEVVSKNDSLRADIIIKEYAKINNTIQNLISSSWDFAINICELNATCPNPGDYENKEIYATEVIVTSNLTAYSPKKLRFFVWRK